MIRKIIREFLRPKLAGLMKGMVMDKDIIKKGYIMRTVILMLTGILYLVLTASVFIFQLDLASDAFIQDIIHITVITSAFSYVQFADMIYGTQQEDKTDGRLALIFAALFTVPLLIGRGIGISYISNSGIFKDEIFNFYAKVSLSMTIEVISWTTLFPLSMVFLSRAFFKKGRGYKTLAVLCLTSSICCFAAFLSFFSTGAVFFFIGIIGWGIIFLLIIILFLIKQVIAYKIGKSTC